jgi:serine protease Do
VRARVILGVMPRTFAVIALAFVGTLGTLLGFLAGGGGVVGHSSLAGPSGAPSFADIVEKVNPAVVHITVVEAGAHAEGHSDDPHGRDLPRRGEGSGFVVDAVRGYILTNHHLVGSSRRIRVRFADKREAAAILVGTDPNTDLALIKVSLTGLQEIRLGDSDAVRVGEWVCAIGNPYVFDHSVTVGVVSSKGRKIWDPSFDAFIQTDAAINPGNSGGPLINIRGEAIGINAAVSTEGQGIGFAIPVNVAREILEQLRTRGRVSRGYLGIQLHELDPDLQKLLGARDGRGAVVLDIVEGTAAQNAGLKRYDVITAVGTDPVEDGDHLIRAISAKAPGSPVSLAVLRDGREMHLEAHLMERMNEPSPAPASDSGEEPTGITFDRLGLNVAELSGPMRSDLQIPRDRVGVVVDEVAAVSSGADALEHGDIIVEVNRKPTPDIASYRKVLSSFKSGDVAWLYVYRASTHPPGSFLAKIDAERP